MKRAEPGWFVLSLAGLAALLGSFLPFYTFSGGVDATVWSRGLFPTATLIPLLGFAVGLEALFVLVRGHEPRSPFLNFTWEQVRLAAGAVMILLALSYLVQDRAGGTLGVGYLVLSLSALATFAGGVMTRRVQLARAPGEEAPVREPQPRLKPAVASVNRFGSRLSKNVSDMSGSVKERLAARKEARETKAMARAEARAEAAAKAAAAAQTAAAAKAAVDAKAATAKAAVDARAAAAKTEADAKAAAAAKTEADAKAAAAKTDADTKAAAAAKTEAASDQAPAMQPPPPTETFDVPPSELPATDKTVEAAATEPPPPSETFDLPPAEPPPAPEKGADEPATEPVATVEEPTAPKEDEEPEKVAEEPATDVAEPTAQEAEEPEKPARVAPLSAVPPKPDPDATAPLDRGKSPSDSDTIEAADDKAVTSKPKDARKSTPREAEAKDGEDGEQETERAETGTES